MDNKEYKYVKFLPWVGEYYKNGEGFQGKKILILGESHYCKEDDNRTELCKIKWVQNDSRCNHECMNDSCYAMTEGLIKGEYFKYRLEYNSLPKVDSKGNKISYKHLQTLLCFERNVLGRETSPEDSVSFWQSVAFYNYMQHAQSGPRKSLEHKDKEYYEKAFREILEELKPNYIIVWGKRLHNNNLLPDSEISSIKIGEHEVPIRNFVVKEITIRALIVEHPCSACGKSRRKWHPMLRAFLELDE